MCFVRFDYDRVVLELRRRQAHKPISVMANPSAVIGQNRPAKVSNLHHFYCIKLTYNVEPIKECIEFFEGRFFKGFNALLI